MPNYPNKVIIHPLVLLSTVDHFNRVAKDTRKRVVGVLLGSIRKGEVDVTNSFAVPFEEEEKNSIWFLDHNYMENMASMFRKINAKENIIGFYSTGPKIRPNDLEINELFKKYTPNPVFVIIDVQYTEDFEIPTKAYVAIEDIKEGETELPKISFQHITSEIGALESEEVGVEHLLRDIKDTSISTLAQQVNTKLSSLKSLISHLQDIQKYLDNVCNGKLPLNHQILSQLQDIFNLSPNLSEEEFSKSFLIKINDILFMIDNMFFYYLF
jgi:26S proteasome regulatory subunit N8